MERTGIEISFSFCDPLSVFSSYCFINAAAASGT